MKLLNHLLSAMLISMLIIPPVKAAELLRTTDIPGDVFEGAGPVWQVMAEHLYENESGLGNIQEKQELSRLLFVDYLDFLNSVGLDLARFEISSKARKDIKDQGACSKQTLDATYRNIQASLDAGLALFTQAYCHSTCRTYQAAKFSAIANFAEPEDESQSCEGKARKIHENYLCSESSLPTLLGEAHFSGSAIEPELKILNTSLEFPSPEEDWALTRNAAKPINTAPITYVPRASVSSERFTLSQEDLDFLKAEFSKANKKPMLLPKKNIAPSPIDAYDLKQMSLDLAENPYFAFNKMNDLGLSAELLSSRPIKNLALPIPAPGHAIRPIEAPASPGDSSLKDLSGMNRAEEASNAAGTHFMTENDFNNYVSAKKKECKQHQVNTLASTVAQPGTIAERKALPLPTSSADPRWTDPAGPSDTDSGQPRTELSGVIPKIFGAKPNLAVTIPKNPACEFSGPDASEHFQKLREAYQVISIAQIDATLGHWPIYDANNQVKGQAMRLIMGTADQLFFGLIDDLQANFNKACGAGGSSFESSRAESSGGTTTIAGRRYIIGIKDGIDDPAKTSEPNPDKADSKSAAQPTAETVATYFQTNSSVVESILNGFLGADQLGSASPIEGRAGVIAQGVKDGRIKPDDVGMEAAKGMTSAQAKEVIRLTEQYLGQGEYQAIKIFAAQLVGGAAGGALLGGAAKGAGFLLTKVSGLTEGALGGGRISALLMAVKESIMRPMLAGGETGAVGTRFFADFWQKKVLDSAKNLGLKNGDEVKKLARWDKGNSVTLDESVKYHHSKHGGDRTLSQYLDDAAKFDKSKATRTPDVGTRPDGSVKWTNDRDFLIERNGQIVTYGPK